MKKHKYLILTIIWMLYIFYMSHQIGAVSSNSSSTVANTFLNFIPLPDSFTYTLETIIRKTAHILEYAILTWLVFQTIKPYSKYVYQLSFIIAIGYACTDELHQYFIPGRTALITDVFIDSIGIIIILLILHLYYKKKRTSDNH
ncbi:MAG: VanZ family protein [Coprobacillaceae bacterium]